MESIGTARSTSVGVSAAAGGLSAHILGWELAIDAAKPIGSRPWLYGRGRVS